MKKRLLILFVLCISCAFAFAQDIRVQGKVLEKSSGNPMPGVQVSVKSDAKRVTVTNGKGEFTLSVPSANATLVIHASGYQDVEEALNGRTNITVSVAGEMASNLDEVVVVGAVLKKKDLTGAVSSVGADKIAQTPTTDINQAIQGKVTGAYVVANPQPGSGASIKIRGNNSLQFGTNPIYVVDGVIIDGSFNTLNPDDIASIDVLKDASATALYGSRGANGVVIVTTKKGRKGEGKVNYNTWVGVQTFAKQMKFMGAQDLYNLRIDAYANKYMDDNPNADRAAYIQNVLLNPDPNAGGIFGPEEMATIKAGKSYNWEDPVTQTGMSQNHTLTFSGGNDKSTYYTSLNYTDQKGLVKGSNYKKFGGRINLDQQVKSWLKVGTSTSFTRSIQNVPDGSIFSTAVGANPMIPVDTAGLYYLKWGNTLDQNYYNPLLSEYIKNDIYMNRILTSNYVNINPIKDLNIRSTLSADIQDQDQYEYTPMITGQDHRNSYHGAATHRKDNWTNLQWDNTATYNMHFGQSGLNLLGGTSLIKRTYNYTQVDARGFPSDDFGYRYLNGSYTRAQDQLQSDFVTNATLSFLGRAEYNYAGKYFATGTLRYDGSSKFGANHRWGAFPSIALAWDMAKENFMSGISAINSLKWRVSYGIAGNQNIPDYAFVSLYRPTYTNGQAVYNSDGREGNPNLQWERQKQLNVGFELALLDGRLNVSADYFSIVNDNLLMQRTISTVSGYNNMIDNVGALQNRGAEANVNYTVIQHKDLRWNVYVNISADKNKVTRLYGNTTAIYNKGGFTGVDIQRTGNVFVGQSINNIYSYKFSKIAQASDMDALKNIDFSGRVVKPGDIVPVDRTGDNKITDDDRYVVGKTDPKFYGGFGTDLGYKRWSLSAFFNYSYGLKRLSGTYEGSMSSAGMSAANIEMLDRWTPDNTNTLVPRAYNGARYNYGDVDLGVQNASFLRLATLSLSYTLPRSATGNIFDNARIYFTGTNLLLVTKDKGYDPETGDGFPNSRNYTFGVSVTL